MTPTEASADFECDLCELELKLERALRSVNLEKLQNLQIDLAYAIKSVLETLREIEDALKFVRNMRAS